MALWAGYVATVLATMPTQASTQARKTKYLISRACCRSTAGTKNCQICQKMIGSDVELYSIRDDVDAPYTAAKLKAELGANVKPIPVTAEITEMLDSKKRLEFIGAWKATLATGAK